MRPVQSVCRTLPRRARNLLTHTSHARDDASPLRTPTHTMGRYIDVELRCSGELWCFVTWPPFGLHLYGGNTETKACSTHASGMQAGILTHTKSEGTCAVSCFVQTSQPETIKSLLSGWGCFPRFAPEASWLRAMTSTLFFFLLLSSLELGDTQVYEP